MRRMVSAPCLTVRSGAAHSCMRALPEETPVAVVYNGSTHAVMMATPDNLEDFALGFSLSEHVIESPEQIERVEIVEQDAGIELRLWLTEERALAMVTRRRMMAGPVGCGLCGIDSLEEALRPITPVGDSALRLSTPDIARAAEALRAAQPLHDQTRGVHAAGFFVPEQGLLLAREDVGRHNALDKLIGAMARAGLDATLGAIVLTSRVSVEMVQKCAVAGAPVLIAASAPTAHAVRLAVGAGITVVALVRDDGFSVFTHKTRIEIGGAKDVA